MKSIQQQRREVRRLWHAAHLALDDLYAPLAVDWEQAVLRHAELQPDGTLRITPMAKAKILATIDASLEGVEPAITLALAAAVKRSTQLPREAVR